MTVHFWIADPENGQGNVRSDVNLAILALLRQEGVGIPFPQRTVHLDLAAAPVTVPAAGSAR